MVGRLSFPFGAHPIFRAFGCEFRSDDLVISMFFFLTDPVCKSTQSSAPPKSSKMIPRFWWEILLDFRAVHFETHLYLLYLLLNDGFFRSINQWFSVLNSQGKECKTCFSKSQQVADPPATGMQDWANTALLSATGSRDYLENKLLWSKSIQLSFSYRFETG